MAVGLVLVLSASPLSGQPSGGQTIDLRREYNVKAVSVYGFCRFVTWPESAFSTESADLVVGIYGDSPIGLPLQSIAGKKTVMQRKLRIVKCASPADVARCHVAFVSASTPLDQQERVITETHEHPVLLVGEQSGFGHTGGVANFYVSNGRVQFELNHEAARSRGLLLNAKLLSLGKEVQRTKLSQSGQRQE